MSAGDLLVYLQVVLHVPAHLEPILMVKHVRPASLHAQLVPVPLSVQLASLARPRLTPRRGAIATAATTAASHLPPQAAALPAIASVLPVIRP